MGISAPPSTSMRALSTPSISSALSRCSTPWNLQDTGTIFDVLVDNMMSFWIARGTSGQVRRAAHLVKHRTSDRLMQT